MKMLILAVTVVLIGLYGDRSFGRLRPAAKSS